MPKGSGTNSQGNHYNTPGGSNSNGGSSYHCTFAKNRPWIRRIASRIFHVARYCSHSNSDGSYYYSNDNGSTYYNNGSGGSRYTAPGK
eukprot:scaffold6306_cov135-Amphora_coffeaeformis.AAC.1